MITFLPFPIPSYFHMQHSNKDEHPNSTVASQSSPHQPSQHQQPPLQQSALQSIKEKDKEKNSSEDSQNQSFDSIPWIGEIGDEHHDKG